MTVEKTLQKSYPWTPAHFEAGHALACGIFLSKLDAVFFFFV